MLALFSRPAFFAFFLTLTVLAVAAGKRGMDMDPYGLASAFAPGGSETAINTDN
ncbi:MAG TPA: hypothetical protein VF017_20815 [Thermoanaerobaculia bacterium]|nr:hypothetical protein [Thermoanaerobaculia bacterium]